jgi:hypothetical protein
LAAQDTGITAIIGTLLRPVHPAYPAVIRTSTFLFLNEGNIDEYDYENCDPIVITTEKTMAFLNQEEQEKRVILVGRAINKALKKGIHVCILCSEPDDPLFGRILSDISMRFFKSAQHISEIAAKRSEFNTFLNNYGTAFGIFSGEPDCVIATTSRADVSALLLEEIIQKDGSDEYIVGFTRKKESGMITFLPFFVPSKWAGLDNRKISKMISELRRCLKTHRKNIEIEEPKWMEEIKLKTEKDLESVIAESERQITPKKEMLERQHYFKSILWFKHDELRDRCMAVLNEMRIVTRKDDIGIEDFWILDSSNADICICEVKGKDGDILKRDLRKFQDNIDAAGKDNSFPALLIANTHNKSDTLAGKDERVPPNVVEHAIRNKILIIRTLDLIKLLDLFQKGEILSDAILKKITHSYGWLKVDQKIKIVRN